MVLKDDWKIGREKSALVTIDLQNTFVAKDAPVEFPTARDFIPRVNDLASLSRKLGIPVIHVYMSVRPDFSDIGLLQEIRPRTDSELEIIDGKRGTKFYGGLDVKETDYLVRKCRYSALIPGSSSLEPLLRGLGRDSLIVCGVATDICVGTTIYDAMMLGFRVFLVSDLTSTFNEDRQRVALEVINRNFAKVMTFDEVKKELKQLESQRSLCEAH